MARRDLLVADLSEASNPGRTTEMGVVLYEAFGIYMCVCVHTNLKFLLPTTKFHDRTYLKNSFRVRLQMSLGTIRASNQTAAKTLHERPSPHPFVL